MKPIVIEHTRHFTLPASGGPFCVHGVATDRPDALCRECEVEFFRRMLEDALRRYAAAVAACDRQGEAR